MLTGRVVTVEPLLGGESALVLFFLFLSRVEWFYSVVSTSAVSIMTQSYVYTYVYISFFSCCLPSCSDGEASLRLVNLLLLWAYTAISMSCDKALSGVAPGGGQ